MYLTDLAVVLRRAGIDVIEVDGWKTRGHGPMTDVRGHTIHHNAGGRTTNPRAGLRTIVEGRAGLAGPLAHTYVDRDGVWYATAAGLAYHAGVSLANDLTNPHRIGTEAQAAGDGWSEDWPDRQMTSLAIGSRALAEHYDYPVSEILGHKETCSPKGRKIDPSFSMPTFRTMVKEAIMLDKNDIKAAVLEVLRDRSLIDNTTQDGSPAGTMSVLDALRLGDFKADRGNDQDKAERVRDDQLTTKVDTLQATIDDLVAKLDTPAP